MQFFVRPLGEHCELNRHCLYVRLGTQNMRVSIGILRKGFKGLEIRNTSS